MESLKQNNSNPMGENNYKEEYFGSDNGYKLAQN